MTTKNTQKNVSELKITRDSGANLKILKELERGGYIKIFDVLGENETKKVENKAKPVGVWNHSKWGDCSVWAGEDSKYSEIREIIGKDNIQDTRKLEAHIRYQHDYFVTEDSDFLRVKDELNKKIGTKVITPEELKKYVKSS